ncbi:MAG: sugar ABC transporter ATP-binding protein [Mesorhizobium sp.]|uniref:sugar ABC transporter ATP-binding protein n=1 Tax=Mesorhizobium sp. TaxID=1871066 RepID=UPI000FE54F77|nr:sugar ABC transporter ATP-binding protein [Mesorhizobium sp.]RWB13408.1 MAG: sugar ABC transporter ATP-binding protein [Mesorhizobium sp.]
MNDVILSLEGVGKIFPGVVALSDVSLSIARGETHIVLGENGAGKSTLIKLLAGIYQPDSGTIAFNGRPYQPKTPHDAQQRGIRIVHQELNLLPYLSIAENLMLESLPRRAFGIVDSKALNRRAVALLKEVGLDVDPRTRVEALGVAQMQLVEIAKALSYDSKLLVLDEPTATLTPPEIERLFSIIKRLKAKGVTIIYISHRLHEVFEIGDRVTVLRNGRLVASRDLHGLSVPDIVRMMIGRDIADEFGFDARVVPGKVALSVTNLKRSAATPEISFAVRHGEILGVAGLVGSGRTEAMRALFGADPKLDGVVEIDGKPVAIAAPKDAVRHGLSLLTEDRKGQGLLLDLAVDKNITITDLGKVSRHGLVNRRAESAAANDLVGQLRVKASSIEQAVRNLSGGNQQKVVLAKWLFRGTSTLILDEPTRGVDIGARREIYQLLWMLAAQQKGIIMVSSDLPELMGMCHRIIVFSRNKIVGEVPRAEFDQERILSLAYQEYVRP